MSIAKSFCLLVGLIMSFGGALSAQGLVQHEMYRYDQQIQYKIPGVDHPDSVIECRRTWIFLRGGGLPEVGKSRMLCKTPSKTFTWFRSFNIKNGSKDILFVDNDNQSWLRIQDVPEIVPRDKDESLDQFGRRLNDKRDHVIRIETSNRKFNAIDGEVLDAGRKRIWEALEQSDPEVVELVTDILENFGSDPSPDWDVILRDLVECVYDGGEISSPELEVHRYQPEIQKMKDDYEISDFEKEFGKCGKSFPDPPSFR